MLETNRIQLVKPSMDLLQKVYEATLESQQELEKFLVWVQSALEEPEKNMRIAIENHEKFSGELRYYIIERQSSQVIGTVGLIIRDETVPFFEIGYWVRSASTGYGYITEAVGVLEKYAFSELGANRLEIRVAKGNSRSRAVAERCSYTLEAELENERRLPSGDLSNTLVYGKCCP